MDPIINGAYWAVIPADVLHDSQLRASAKLLYAELTTLANSTGYCWATNEYLGSLFSLSAESISRLVSQLEKKGYIRTEIVPAEKGVERRIYAGAFVVIPQGGLDKNVKTPGGDLDENVKTGLDENVKTGLDENVKTHIRMNNINNNITPKAPKRGRQRAELKDAPDWKPERFAGFWKFYPRHENKQAAIRAWDKLRPGDELIDRMAAALVVLKATPDWTRGIGIPHASTWLNNARWEDAEQPQAAEAGAAASGWAEDPEVLDG